MTDIQKTISPIDGTVYLERPLASEKEIQTALQKASAMQCEWRNTPISERARLLSRFVDIMVSRKEIIAEELSWQMGRPIIHGPNELRGFEERSRYMISIAGDALGRVDAGKKEGFIRFITREPLGIIFVIAPWNYPFLTSVNAIVPALMAGNAVLLKHSAQTPLVAEHYTSAGLEAGLPEGLLQHLHLGHDQVDRIIADPVVSYVAFTGSVEGGRSVHRAAANRFIGMGLELGGKDSAYVRYDARLGHAVETLVDGSFYNAGQSCCGIKRIYAHKDIYDGFIEAFEAETYRYNRLGNPLDEKTTLGPVVRTSAADNIRRQIVKAVAAGATPLIDEGRFPAAAPQTPYLAPQVMVNVNHSMSIMMEETFGPLVCIMPVGSDEEAVAMINDSRFGLTASIFTQDENAALTTGKLANTGTWFMNRCDYLDPALAWVGIKDSGCGCTLSRVGYEYLTRPKSFHLRTQL
ncbi:MAG: aldehyde dehydrogenase family protein [Desulfobacterales bacterium]|jgi:acyl-CoA reductase-like NAD-dependent aldehyde dehydrogenase|nr:aldehyde dehydrogenase family protein [Desulfobacterales bacterium]